MGRVFAAEIFFILLVLETGLFPNGGGGIFSLSFCYAWMHEMHETQMLTQDHDYLRSHDV